MSACPSWSPPPSALSAVPHTASARPANDTIPCPPPVAMGMTPDRALAECAALVRNAAWSWHRSTGVPLDDLEQEARMAVLRAAAAYVDDSAPFTAFAALKIRWHLRDVVRVEKRRGFTGTNRGAKAADVRAVAVDDLQPLDGDPGHAALGVDADQEDAAEREAQRRAVRRACAGLSARDVEVLRLTLEGHSLAEIAARLGISETRACQLRAAAEGNLRAVVRGEVAPKPAAPPPAPAPPRAKRPTWTWDGRTYASLAVLCRAVGVPYGRVRERLLRGKALAQALGVDEVVAVRPSLPPPSAAA